MEFLVSQLFTRYALVLQSHILQMKKRDSNKELDKIIPLFSGIPPGVFRDLG